ncbi:MAG TPA: hypothetical protein DEQ40_14370 [Oxalobacteraceae bacterium]|jgi:hypothetical protein|nr:hypothetical protein [Oxalobacteraceae bacterium]
MNQVYFILAEGLGLVKIGKASDLNLRLYALQVSSPVPLSILASVKGGHDVELALHRRFHASRQQGEWFRLTPDLQEFIEEAQSNPLPIEQSVSVEYGGLTWRVTPSQFFRWMEFLFGLTWPDTGYAAIGCSRPELRRWWLDAQDGICSIPARALRGIMAEHRQRIVRIKTQAVIGR